MGFRELLVVCGCLWFAMPALGQQRRFGTWTVGDSDGGAYVYAVTFSDTGNVLGLYCDVSQNQCIWALGMKTSCASDAEARYPALMNSPAGAYPLQLICGGLDDRGFYRYAFADYASADNAIRSSQRVSFAFPMGEDQFSVVRFSLAGMTPAVEYLRNLQARKARAAPDVTTRQRVKDETL